MNEVATATRWDLTGATSSRDEGELSRALMRWTRPETRIPIRAPRRPPWAPGRRPRAAESSSKWSAESTRVVSSRALPKNAATYISLCHHHSRVTWGRHSYLATTRCAPPADETTHRHTYIRSDATMAAPWTSRDQYTKHLFAPKTCGPRTPSRSTHKHHAGWGRPRSGGRRVGRGG